MGRCKEKGGGGWYKEKELHWCEGNEFIQFTHVDRQHLSRRTWQNTKRGWKTILKLHVSDFNPLYSAFRTKGQWLKWHHGKQTRFIGMKATSWKSSKQTLPKCFGLDYFVWSFNYLQPFLQTFYWEDISKCLYCDISYWRNDIQCCYSGSKTSENYWTSV